MKKVFLSKQSKKINKLHQLLPLLFLCGLIATFKVLNKTQVITIKDKELVTYLLQETTKSKSKNQLYTLTKNFLVNIYNNPTTYLLTTKSNLIKENKQTVPVVNEVTKKDDYLIYIYNSHQTEEYAASSFLEYSVNPTVMMADYIIEDAFNKNEYKTLVEEESIKEILNSNNWKYSYSYHASRMLLEKRKSENPTLKYFIDVHRDSLKKERTTITIGDKDYATLLFIVGLDNVSYQSNLDFTTNINSCLDTNYPSLSKGIYKKSGTGVNGIYNQDFSPYTILVEIGGYENTTTEVLNSSLAFSECFMEVISKNESEANS